uniref:Uncharacterized protein n=1 Tax=Ciona intestinalis TaxID=7719 RepID=H2XKM6_CIOIN
RSVIKVLVKEETFCTTLQQQASLRRHI